MHTFVKAIDAETHEPYWTIGYFAILKTNGTQTFMPIAKFGSRQDAVIAVNVLNGGSPTQAINVLEEYSEGLNPTTEADPFERLRK